MKINLFIKPVATLFCFFLVCQTSFAQTGIVKYAPFVNFGYEHVLSEKRSIYGGINLGTFDGTIGAKVEYRFYGLIKKDEKKAPEGLWVAPIVSVTSAVINDYGFKERFLLAQAGGIAGYQWIFKNKITFEPGLGIAASVIGGNRLFDDVFGGLGFVTPILALRVGYVVK